jgi:CrcB protein
VSPIAVIGIGLVGAVGALARFALDGAISDRLGREFPYGTLAVNLTGSFVLGLLVGAAVNGDGYRIAGTGLVGAYTTFSTWAFESHRLGEDGQLNLAGLNFAISLILGTLAVWLGRHAGALV